MKELRMHGRHTMMWDETRPMGDDLVWITDGNGELINVPTVFSKKKDACLAWVDPKEGNVVCAQPTKREVVHMGRFKTKEEALEVMYQMVLTGVIQFNTDYR